MAWCGLLCCAVLCCGVVWRVTCGVWRGVVWCTGEGEVEVRKFSQFPAIHRNFPQSSRNFSALPILLLVPLAAKGEPYKCARLCRAMRLGQHPPVHASIPSPPAIVLPVDLLYARKRESEPPVQNCCTLRVKEGCLRYRSFPAISRNFPHFPHIFPQLSAFPPQFPATFRIFPAILFLQLDSTPPDHIAPPAPVWCGVVWLGGVGWGGVGRGRSEERRCMGWKSLELCCGAAVAPWVCNGLCLHSINLCAGPSSAQVPRSW